MTDEHEPEAITASIHREIGDDVSAFVGGEEPAPIVLPHSWPFDDEEADRLGLTPSQRSRLVRSAFTDLLPSGLTTQERHDAWHRFQLSHPGIWPACHGALANRVEEQEFFRNWVNHEAQQGPSTD